MLDALLLTYVGFGPAPFFFGPRALPSISPFVLFPPLFHSDAADACQSALDTPRRVSSPLPPPFLGTVANISIRSR